MKDAQTRLEDLAARAFHLREGTRELKERQEKFNADMKAYLTELSDGAASEVSLPELMLKYQRSACIG